MIEARGSLIIDGHHVWFVAVRQGDTLVVMPLHNDAPESQQESLLAHFADTVRAMFFVEPKPQTPQLSSGGPVDAGGMYLLADGSAPEMFLPRPSGLPDEDLGYTTSSSSFVDIEGKEHDRESE
jgi:hypothetical protein